MYLYNGLFNKSVNYSHSIEYTNWFILGKIGVIECCEILPIRDPSAADKIFIRKYFKIKFYKK